MSGVDEKYPDDLVLGDVLVLDNVYYMIIGIDETHFEVRCPDESTFSWRRAIIHQRITQNIVTVL
jgi:hypothetical protein